MFRLTEDMRFYLYTGKVSLRRGCLILGELVRSSMGCAPLDSSNMYVFMNSAHTIVRLIHYERGFYVMYEKRPSSGPVFSRAITDCSYLMIDETCELVGVIDPATNIPEYMRKYLWAFHDKQSGLVWYLYDHGSRAREVVAKVLPDFKGYFTSDGYTVYKAFSNMEEYPHLIHCGCWVHVRQNFIEVLGVASEICWEFIEEIDMLFENERLFKGIPDQQRGSCRQQTSLPVPNRIYCMAKRVASDAELMGRSILRKAVNYINNQTEILRNFIHNGKVEISNNLCEQRIKPIKLDLKNCQNIGSEGAAENAAFMHSLVESCRLNDKNPYDYLLALFRKMRSGLDAICKRLLLPDRWVPECLKRNQHKFYLSPLNP